MPIQMIALGGCFFAVGMATFSDGQAWIRAIALAVSAPGIILGILNMIQMKWTKGNNLL